jgi:protein TonB
MEPKKNPKIDPNRNGFVYFSLGLMLMAMLSYAAIELKSYEKNIVSDASAVDDSFLDEDVPVTMPPNTPPPPPPPPPPPAPEVIQVVDDKKVIEEKIIESTETNQEQVVEKPVEAKKVEVIEEEDDAEVAFQIIEDIPVFPGCEKEKTKEAKMKCFNEKIMKHFSNKFEYPEVAKENNLQGRVFAGFRIEKDGTIKLLNVGRSPHPSIDKALEKAFSSLPKMTPGKQRGKPVPVTYNIPIVLKLD